MDSHGTVLTMRLIDDIIYYTCCFGVILHSISALLVVTHGRCGVYAAAFLIACIMWIDLTALNLWFFLPTVIREATNIEFTSTGNLMNDVLAGAHTLFFSVAASNLITMLFGWFAGSMSLSNALCMWQREGCDGIDSHCHSGLSKRLIRAAYWTEERVGIRDAGYLPFLEDAEKAAASRSSVLFIVPRERLGLGRLVIRRDTGRGMTHPSQPRPQGGAETVPSPGA
ncbi:hypothetical protein BX600DRAFT_442530 [Xylariales sp. PMI_506]|nr:hypothetical protein BX600DRAFT_442530 [Xylariales sp. PMI_506]